MAELLEASSPFPGLTTSAVPWPIHAMDLIRSCLASPLPAAGRPLSHLDPQGAGRQDLWPHLEGIPTGVYGICHSLVTIWTDFFASQFKAWTFFSSPQAFSQPSAGSAQRPTLVGALDTGGLASAAPSKCHSSPGGARCSGLFLPAPLQNRLENF